MKFLLTSAGITNDSIRKALVYLLGKPIAESKALCIPTAICAEPGGPGYAWQEIREWGEMGWKAFGVLERQPLPGEADHAPGACCAVLSVLAPRTLSNPSHPIRVSVARHSQDPQARRRLRWGYRALWTLQSVCPGGQPVLSECCRW